MFRRKHHGTNERSLFNHNTTGCCDVKILGANLTPLFLSNYTTDHLITWIRLGPFLWTCQRFPTEISRISGKIRIFFPKYPGMSGNLVISVNFNPVILLLNINLCALISIIWVGNNLKSYPNWYEVYNMRYYIIYLLSPFLVRTRSLQPHMKWTRIVPR